MLIPKLGAKYEADGRAFAEAMLKAKRRAAELKPYFDIDQRLGEAMSALDGIIDGEEYAKKSGDYPQIISSMARIAKMCQEKLAAIIAGAPPVVKELVSEDGGFLVPPEVAQELFRGREVIGDWHTPAGVSPFVTTQPVTGFVDNASTYSGGQHRYDPPAADVSLSDKDSKCRAAMARGEATINQVRGWFGLPGIGTAGDQYVSTDDPPALPTEPEANPSNRGYEFL